MLFQHISTQTVPALYPRDEARRVNQNPVQRGLTAGELGWRIRSDPNSALERSGRTATKRHHPENKHRERPVLYREHRAGRRPERLAPPVSCRSRAVCADNRGERARSLGTQPSPGIGTISSGQNRLTCHAREQLPCRCLHRHIRLAQQQSG